MDRAATRCTRPSPRASASCSPSPSRIRSKPTTTTTSTCRRSSSRRVGAVAPARGDEDTMAAACWSVATTTGLVRALTSDRSDGDFHAGHAWAGRPEGGDLDRRRRALVDLPWTMLDEHHGTTVVRVDAPGDGDGM